MLFRSPGKEFHTRNIPHQPFNPFSHLRWFPAMFPNWRINQAMNSFVHPFWSSSCRKQANFRVRPCPEPKPSKPLIRLFPATFRPAESQCLVNKPPMPDGFQCLWKTGECDPQEQCTVLVRDPRNVQRSNLLRCHGMVMVFRTASLPFFRIDMV